MSIIMIIIVVIIIIIIIITICSFHVYYPGTVGMHGMKHLTV